MSQQSRRWVCTSYNLDHLELWQSMELTTYFSYVVCQEEKCPNTGTHHIQAYFETHTKRTKGSVFKKLTGIMLKKSKELGYSFTVAVAKGTARHNLTYCTKSETSIEGQEPVVRGEPKQQGERLDLAEMYSLIKEGKNNADLLELCPGMYMKWSKAIKEARRVYLEANTPHWRAVKVNVLYGPTRSGKTSSVYRQHDPDDVFKLTIKQSGNVWFDGYEGQSVLLIDDFYGQIKVSYMLQLLDGYRQLLEIKGDHVAAQWNTIYITSNDHPMDWYSGYCNLSCAVMHAVQKRISSITKVIPPAENSEPCWVDVVEVNGAIGGTESKSEGGKVITPPTSSKFLRGSPESKATCVSLLDLAHTITPGDYDPTEHRAIGMARYEGIKLSYPPPPNKSKENPLSYAKRD